MEQSDRQITFEGEVIEHFGILPNFFRSAEAAPELIQQRAWRLARLVVDPWEASAGLSPASAVPHASQNLAVGLFSAAHFGQRLDSGKTPRCMRHLAVPPFFG